MDWTILQFLIAPIVASLIIAGIHAYLGLHVVERGVIFVDLSLAQIASLGAAIAVWLGYDAGAPAIYWMSLGFTLLGALIFAMIKGQDAHIPQEAIIGISYAVASAAVILTMSKTTGEAEHLKDMLVGNILSVQWPEVWLTGGIYLVDRRVPLGLPQALPGDFDRRQGAAARGMPVRFWDFLFYASFGFVVTRSVAIAGVLLVFCYLIVPSVGAMLWAKGIGSRLAIGWVMGVVVSILGMYFSVLFDLPTGATIVCTFGVALVIMALVRPLVLQKAALSAAYIIRECNVGTAERRSPTRRSSASGAGRRRPIRCGRPRRSCPGARRWSRSWPLSR